MPIYEFYCAPCNTLFSFYSKTINTAAQPACPRCGTALARRVSLCSIPERSKKVRDIDALPLSEARLSEGMRRLEREVEKLREQDPRQARRMLQKFTRMTGVRFNELFEKNAARAAEEDTAGEGPRPGETPARDPRLYEL